MAILKANAYGHGLEAVARCLAPQADSFGVALVEEGIALRRLGIAQPDPGAWAAPGRARSRSSSSTTWRSPCRRWRGCATSRTPRPRADDRPRAPQDRHRDGAHRRAPLQRRGPARRGRALAPRRGRGHLLALRQRRRGRPLARAPAARALLTRCCASTSGVRCRRPCATSPTRPRSCGCPSRGSTWSGRASCSTASTRTPARRARSRSSRRCPGARASSTSRWSSPAAP